MGIKIILRYHFKMLPKFSCLLFRNFETAGIYGDFEIFLFKIKFKIKRVMGHIGPILELVACIGRDTHTCAAPSPCCVSFFDPFLKK